MSDSEPKDAPSYHDVVVTVDGLTIRLRDNYAHLLTCTRVAGWQLFWRPLGGKREELIGGEYDSRQFRIQVRDMVICDVDRDAEEGEEKE